MRNCGSLAPLQHPFLKRTYTHSHHALFLSANRAWWLRNSQSSFPQLFVITVESPDWESLLFPVLASIRCPVAPTPPPSLLPHSLPTKFLSSQGWRKGINVKGSDAGASEARFVPLREKRTFLNAGTTPPNTSPQQDPPLFWTQCSEFQGGLKKGYGWWIGFLVSSLGSQTEFSRWSGVEWGRSAVISSARFVPCLQDIFRAKLHGSELMRGSTEQRLQSDGWLVDL